MTVKGIFAADLHFSHTAPVARSAEPDWYLAQKRVINQLKSLMKEHKAPLIVAGDISDKSGAPPHVIPAEFVNFLLDTLPPFYAAAGNHDLPNHILDQRHRSLFGILVRAGKIIELEPGLCQNLPGLRLYGFPCGFEPQPLTRRYEDTIHVAVVHEYVWKKGHSFPDAPVEMHASRYRDKLAGYDCSAFGDNHQGFFTDPDDPKYPTQIFNCGTLMRRKTDERDYRPMVGLLKEDGNLYPHYLDVSEDLWLEESLPSPEEPKDFDASRFVKSLQSLGVDSLDFREALKHEMERDQTREPVRNIVLKSTP
jgi:DNA repair exonuclease SbcCD nuclease subunit